MTFSLRKTGGNALAILSSDVMNRAASFVLYAFVARHLGAHEFGQLSLALTLFYIFQVFAAAGLKILVTRQVAKDRSQTGAYFINGCTGAAGTSVLALVAIFAFVRLMHYPSSTKLVILVLSLGLLPYAVSAVCEGVFQAWEHMRYIAYVNVPVNVLKICCAFLLLAKMRGLYPVVLILLFSLVSVALVEVWILVRRFPTRQASINPRFSLAMIRSSGTFLGIDGVVAIMSGLNTVLLSKVANETQVGLYNAATQLMVPLLLVYQSIALSVFPMMCRKVEPGLQGLKRIAEDSIEVLLALALPVVAGIFFLGDWALSILYKNSVFLQAFAALRIIMWILIFRVFTHVLGSVLVAVHRERVNLRIVIVDTLVNLLVGWPLISRFGLVGAAITLLLTTLADLLQHYVAVWRLLSGISVTKIAWKPIVAAGCMAGYLAMSSGRRGIVSGVSATLIYGGALLALTIGASGGLRQFKEKYRPLLS